MYINAKLLTQRGLSLLEHSLLCIIRQQKFEDNTELLETELHLPILEKLIDLELITFIKPKNKSQKDFERIRLTDKGRNWLEDIETPEVQEEHLKMRDYLIQMYLSHEDKERVVGNKKLIGIYISVLQSYLGLDIYRFYYLCEFFLSEHIFTKKLENIFMDRNKIRYGEFKNHIEDSALFQFYEQRKSEVEWYWKQKIKV